MSKIITCEQVSNGHPDKICDQIADAIVTDILQHDRHARVAIECLLKKSQLFIAGEVTTDYRPNYQQIVHDVFNRIGAEKLGWNLTELLRIGILVDKQSPDIALGVDKGGAGALSGKDPTKVDRSAAYMARKIAKDIVQAGYADKCEVQLAYAIGVVQPVGVAVECFGTEHQSLDFIEAYVHDSYDLTPQGIIKRLGLLDVDYNKVSAYGHFGKAGLPWEE